MKILTPEKDEIIKMLGREVYSVWLSIEEFVLSSYKNVQPVWFGASKGGAYECKFKKGTKTICSLFAKDKALGFMVIYGKEERRKFEEQKASFSTQTQEIYEQSKTYHDGKWMMFNVAAKTPITQFKKLIVVKRAPDVK